MTDELRTLQRMTDPVDMGRVGDSIDEVTDEIKARTRVPGTYLPVLLVEAQTELAAMPDHKVTKMLADLVVHVAVRRSLTPQKLLAELVETYPITEQSWHERVGPELRKVLARAGYEIVKLQPTPPYVECDNCGRQTTGDHTWDWPERRMVVCSICASMGQPQEAPSAT